jgi:MFS superfamily sulfate permease-like transporter
VLGQVRALLRDAGPVQTVMMSLEESPDVDGSAIEALRIFAAECRSRNLKLMLVRLKPRALRALQRAADDVMPADALHELSVDECVASVNGAKAPGAATQS